MGVGRCHLKSVIDIGMLSSLSLWILPRAMSSFRHHLSVKALDHCYPALLLAWWGEEGEASEVRAQGNKVGRLWFFGGRCSRISGGTPANSGHCPWGRVPKVAPLSAPRSPSSLTYGPHPTAPPTGCQSRGTRSALNGRSRPQWLPREHNWGYPHPPLPDRKSVG